MKKAIFAVLIVLLAMLATTCDSAVVVPANLSTGGPNPVTPPAVEPNWVTVSIGIAESNGLARAMSQTLNKGAVDFYEVVFSYNGGAITVRDIKEVSPAGQVPGTWNVVVPAVNYATTGSNIAVLYAGKKGSGNTSGVLFAVGTITANGQLAGADTTITFTLNAITSGVNTTYASSAFQITDAGDINPANIPTITAEGSVTAPYFQIVEGLTAVPASYTFTLPANANAHISGAGTVAAATVGTPIPALTPSSSTPIVLDTSATAPTTGALGTAATFTFSITPGMSLGYGKISIAVPVYAINTTHHTTNGTQSYVIWSLEGGQNNDTLDIGTNNGGAILLRVIATPVPAVSVTKGAGAATGVKGWNQSNSTWTVSLVVELEEDIVLDAAAAGFTNNSAVAFTWFTTTSTTANIGVDASVSTITGAVVSGTYNETLTFAYPYSDTSLTTTTPGTFYVYAVGTEGTQSDDSSLIKIVVQNDPVDTSVGIIVDPVFFQ